MSRSGRKVLAVLLLAAGVAVPAAPAGAAEVRSAVLTAERPPVPAPPEVSQRIFGGGPAAEGTLGFNVFMAVDHAGPTIACTGSVIGPAWVLTAAHCLTDDTGSFLPGLVGVDVIAGVTDLNDATPANVLPAASVSVPLGYNPQVSGFANDWALLGMSGALPAEGLPLARADQAAFDAPGTVASLSGFGLIGEVGGTVPTVLQVGTAPILSDADCTAYFGPAHVPGLMNCTGPPPGDPPVDATTCPGDSGGPLFVPFGTGYLQSGITSFGPFPCELTRTGGYTKVSAFADDIVAAITADDAAVGAPLATTGAVAQVHADGLTVEGEVDPNSLATNYAVAWGTTPDLGGGVVRGYAGQGPDPVAVAARIAGAPAGTTLHYRVSAISAAGVSDGDVATGTTAMAGPPQAPGGGGAAPPAGGGGAQAPADTGTARCAGVPATIAGTGGPDVLTGTPGPDVIAGLGGDDVINGLGGDDLICPDEGRDTVDAGAGDDRVVASAGADTVRGNLGRDAVDGGPGSDDVRGGPGADVLTGGPGDDRLRGGADGDSLRGGTGFDVLRGDGGVDLLFGDTGADTLRGDDGADRLRGGPGRDLLIGGSGDDLALGKTSADRIFGGPGDDALYGNEDADRLVGGTGIDRGIGGLGRDVCDTERRSSCEAA